MPLTTPIEFIGKGRIGAARYEETKKKGNQNFSALAFLFTIKKGKSKSHKKITEIKGRGVRFNERRQVMQRPGGDRDVSFKRQMSEENPAS